MCRRRSGADDKPLRALIFDSHYDAYKGVIAYVRVVDGRISAADRLPHDGDGQLRRGAGGGLLQPDARRHESLSAGEVGYVATGFKNVKDCQVGDTMTLTSAPIHRGAAGYRPAKPMVFAGVYSRWRATTTRCCATRWTGCSLNDASLVFEPENSVALGFGFRCGFLGLLHMEIIQERLEREYNLDICSATAPSVEYMVTRTNGEVDHGAQSGGAASAHARFRRDRRAADGYLDLHAGAVHRRDHGSGDRRVAASSKI